MKLENLCKWVLLTLLLFTFRVQAQVGLDKIAQSTMNFQQVGLSAKASALGEAFCAVGRGSEALFYNPAGVAEMDHTYDLRVYATQWIADIQYLAGALAWDWDRYGTIALSIMAVDYGDIHTTALLSAAETTLYPEGYKDTGLAENVGAYSIGLTYGRAISTQFFIAANARLVGQNLGSTVMSAGAIKDNSALKLVFDAGVKYYTGLKSFRFGMAIRNFSSNIKREEINEQMPLTFTMGAAMNLIDLFSVQAANKNALTLAIDFVHPNNYSERMNIGLEYAYASRIALRAGYQSNQDLASWSAGMGLNTQVGKNRVTIDYSYSYFEIFDGVSRLAMGIGF